MKCLTENKVLYLYRFKILIMKNTLIFIILFISFSTNAQNAQDIIDGLKKELKTNPNAQKTATIYSDLTWYYSDISLDSALVYGKKAITESLSIGDSILISQAYGDMSSVYLKKGEYNNSLQYMQKVLTIRKAKKDISGIARVYAGIGLLYFTQNKYDLSMKNYLLALEYVNKTNDEKVKNNIKNAMSGLLLDLKDYKKALSYSEQAIAFYEKNNATATLCPMYINKGNILIGLKDTLNAMKMFEKGRAICNATGNKLFLSKALNNIGTIKIAQKKFSESKKVFDESKINSKQLNSEVLDFRMKLIDVDVLNREKKFKESKILLLKLKKYFEEQNDNENLLITYKNFIPVCSYLFENDSVVYYQTKFLDLNQKINDTEILKKTIELETKYQSAKKEKLILQKEAEVKKRNLYLVGLSGLILLLGTIGYLINRQQKQKIAQQKQEFKLKKAISKIETQNQLQEQRLSISRDLHDNIGSQLTFIISSVENVKYGFDIDNPKLENKLTNISSFARETIVELRDTIWAMNHNEISYEDLEIRINNYIEKAKLSKDQISFSFAIDPKLKTQILTSVQGMNIYRTIQESVNNAIKYANASIIAVNAKLVENQTQITITDNGSGFDSETIESGNGLQNMKKRIEEIGGKFTISSNNDGTRVEILV